MRVGFVGLGSQGAPMARRIVDAGHPLTIWARRPATLEPFADTAAVVAESPAALGARSELVGICVMADADVDEVVLGVDGVLGGMAPGGLVAIHSTVHPDTCRRIADRAAQHGVGVIDAPVSGGAPAADAGRLLVMVGGEAAAVDQARPVLSTYGDPVLHLGPLGSGQVAKLLNNLVFTAQLLVGLETFDLAERLGVDRAAMAQVLASGSGHSFGAAVVAGSGFGTAGMQPVVTTILAKDVGIMRDIAEQAGADEAPNLTVLARATLSRYAEGE